MHEPSFPEDHPADASATAEPFAAAASGSPESPRSVTRGETPGEDGQHTATAIVDWLAFSVRLPIGQDLEWLLGAVETTFRVPREGWIDRGRGWMGYSHRIDLGEFGLVAYGGDAQRDTLHVELNAAACRRIEDWNAVRMWCEVYAVAITRADVAHDDFEAARVDVGRAVEWYRSGEFDSNGRPPHSELRDDMGSNRGKTLYVGRRSSGKLLRVYEKGKQLGDPQSPWVRVEVEFRNKGRIVPLDIVSSPGRYLAGAYPALAFLCCDQSHIRTTQRAAAISYEAMVRNLRMQGGKSLNVMCRVHQGDCGAVLAQLVRQGVPKRLAGYGDALDAIGTQHGVDA